MWKKKFVCHSQLSVRQVSVCLVCSRVCLSAVFPCEWIYLNDGFHLCVFFLFIVYWWPFCFYEYSLCVSVCGGASMCVSVFKYVCVLTPLPVTLLSACGEPYASCHPLPHWITHTRAHTQTHTHTYTHKAQGPGGLPVLGTLSVICPLAADLHTYTLSLRCTHKHTKQIHACIQQQGE